MTPAVAVGVFRHMSASPAPVLVVLLLTAAPLSACSGPPTAPAPVTSPTATPAVESPSTAAPRVAEGTDVQPELVVQRSVLPDHTRTYTPAAVRHAINLADGSVAAAGHFAERRGDKISARVWLARGRNDWVTAEPAGTDAESAATSVAVANPVVAGGWAVDGGGVRRARLWHLDADAEVTRTEDPLGPKRAGQVRALGATPAGPVALVAEDTIDGKRLVVVGPVGERPIETPRDAAIVDGTGVASLGPVVVVTARVRFDADGERSMMWAATGDGPFSVIDDPDLDGHDLGTPVLADEGLVMGAAPVSNALTSLARSADGLDWWIEPIDGSSAVEGRDRFGGAGRVAYRDGTLVVATGSDFPAVVVIDGGVTTWGDPYRYWNDVFVDAHPLVIDGEPELAINYHAEFVVTGLGRPYRLEAELDYAAVTHTVLESLAGGVEAAVASRGHRVGGRAIGSRYRWTSLTPSGDQAPEQLWVPDEIDRMLSAGGRDVAVGIGAELASRSGGDAGGELEAWQRRPGESWRSTGLLAEGPGYQFGEALVANADGFLVVGGQSIRTPLGEERVTPLIVRFTAGTITTESVEGVETGWWDGAASIDGLLLVTGIEGTDESGPRVVAVRPPEGRWARVDVGVPAGASTVVAVATASTVGAVMELSDRLEVLTTDDGIHVDRREVVRPAGVSVGDVVAVGESLVVVGVDARGGVGRLGLWLVGESGLVPLGRLVGGDDRSAELQIDEALVRDDRLLVSGVLHGQGVVWSIALPMDQLEPAGE